MEETFQLLESKYLNSPVSQDKVAQPVSYVDNSCNACLHAGIRASMDRGAMSRFRSLADICKDGELFTLEAL